MEFTVQMTERSYCTREFGFVAKPARYNAPTFTRGGNTTPHKCEQDFFSRRFQKYPPDFTPRMQIVQRSGDAFSYNVELFANKSHIVLKKVGVQSILSTFKHAFKYTALNCRRRKRSERTLPLPCGNLCPSENYENYVSVQSVTDVWKFAATAPMLPMSEH